MRCLQIKCFIIALLFIVLIPVFAKEISILDNPFQYDDEYQDEGTPLLYLKARYLNQETPVAYFITHDFGETREEKILSDGDYNAFAANPIGNEDPSGHGVFTSKIVQDAFDNVLAKDEALETAASFFAKAEAESLVTPRILGDTVYIPSQLLGREIKRNVDEKFAKDYADSILTMNRGNSQFDNDASLPARYMSAVGRFSRHRLYDPQLARLIMGYTDFPDLLSSPNLMQEMQENKRISQNVIYNLKWGREQFIGYPPVTRDLDASFLRMQQLPRGARLRLIFQFDHKGCAVFDTSNSYLYKDRLTGEFMVEQQLYSIKIN